MSALTFENVGMTFPDGTVALEGVSFGVREGEFVSVVGPSGCGKSTLLRIASALERHTAGSCDVDGSKIGYVFQDATLLPWRTVRRNVELIAELSGIGGAERERLAAETIQLVGLQGFEDKYPRQLSGGMKMRASLARSLVMNPRTFLFDEPFGALDESLREELGWEVRSILSRRGTAAVLVTHDRHEALTLGDEVAVMEAGRIVQRGTPREVYQSPASRFVAGFIAVSSYVPTADGGEVLVRPHEVRVVEGGPHTVERVEFLGPTHRYTVRTADGAALVADVGPDIPLAVGSRCDVEVLAR
ncbi:MAG: ABC transporter ATP-binding protein [Ilumatobacteraceae bacterium]